MAAVTMICSRCNAICVYVNYRYTGHPVLLELEPSADAHHPIFPDGTTLNLPAKAQKKLRKEGVAMHPVHHHLDD